MTNIEDLRARLKVLLGLLEDAHPGLSTWHEGYERAAANVLSFWGYGVANVSLLPAATQEQPAGSGALTRERAEQVAGYLVRDCVMKWNASRDNRGMISDIADTLMQMPGSPRKVGEDGAHGALREALGELLGKFERHATYRLISQDETELTGNFRWLPTEKLFIEDVRYQEMLALLSLSSLIEPPREREMWVHSGYTKNGYQQMATPQKALYDSLVGRSEEIAEQDMPQTAVMRERAQASSEIREALAKIKALVSGDRLPLWKEDGLTVTATRYTIADICDAALAPSRQGAGGK